MGFCCGFDVHNLIFVCTRVLLLVKLMTMTVNLLFFQGSPFASTLLREREKEQAQPKALDLSNTGYTVYSFVLGHYWKW